VYFYAFFFSSFFFHRPAPFALICDGTL
jgi:hypothetical protein